MAGSAAETKVEINYRWIVLLLSVVPFALLRGHRTALLVYCLVLSALLVALLLWLPRRVAEAERRFTRESLRLLAMQDFEALKRFAGAQRFLATFGRRHLIPETLGLAAAAAGRHEEACEHYGRALAVAPAEERLRVEVNLAGEELATGRLNEAEGRYRTVLRRRPDLPLALGNLGRLLVQRGGPREELEEAVELLNRALPMADGREIPVLQAALAQARERLAERRA